MMLTRLVIRGANGVINPDNPPIFADIRSYFTFSRFHPYGLAISLKPTSVQALNCYFLKLVDKSAWHAGTPSLAKREGNVRFCRHLTTYLKSLGRECGTIGWCFGFYSLHLPNFSFVHWRTQERHFKSGTTRLCTIYSRQTLGTKQNILGLVSVSGQPCTSFQFFA